MARILVFDSGFGGLSILAALKVLSADVIVDYAADFVYFPYGEKSDKALSNRLPALLARFFEIASPDVIILACNTATTLSLEAIRAAVPCQIVGTVPAIKPAAKLTKTGAVGLLATPATITRAYTDALIEKFASEIAIVKIGSSRLVNLAETVLKGEDYSEDAFWLEQKPFFEHTPLVDTIVLGCTHFPHIQTHLKAAARANGFDAEYVDPSRAIAKHALSLITRRPQHTLDKAHEGGVAFSTSPLSDAEIKVFEKFGLAKTQIMSLAT